MERLYNSDILIEDPWMLKSEKKEQGEKESLIISEKAELVPRWRFSLKKY